MLQPLQLQDVSVRYAPEIAELRDFFRKAGCPPGPGALHAISLRLMRERAFHRDLTSHLWVLIHPHHQNIGYADLLGVLAVAAVGIHAAAEADEDDAHVLLGFLMDARESLDAVRGHSVAQPARPTALAPPASPSTPSRPLPLKNIAEPALSHLRTLPLAESSSHEEEEPSGSRKRLLWISVCVLVALATAFELHNLSAPAPASSPAPATILSSGTASSETAATATTAPPQPSASVNEMPPSEAPRAPAPAASPSRSASRATSTISQPRNANPPAAEPPLTAAPPAAQPTVTAAATPAPRVSPPPISHAAPAPTPAGPRVPSLASTVKPPVRTPSPVHLNATPAYTESSTPDPATLTRKHPVPHLLVRTPEEKAEILAAYRPGGLQSSSPPVPAPAVPHGTVRADSIGAYAANVIYDPTPDYPPDAYAAHVQGEVKLESQVDGDGNVTSVRVVSGPPQLRAAALDAAQRWRYRPNTAGTRHLPMITITVFFFQLP